MPVYYLGYDRPDPIIARRRKAWEAHYVAKGCSKEKAYWCARKKSKTFPPK